MDINELAKEYYQILDSYDPTGVWINETTVEDCKGDIENYSYYKENPEQIPEFLISKIYTPYIPNDQIIQTGIPFSSIINPNIFCNELKCPICFEFPLNPIQCSDCETIFCSYCINKSLKNNKKCPECRGNFEESKIPRKLRNMIELLEFKCIHNGCNKILNILNYSEHVNNCSKRIKFKCNLCSFIGNGNSIFLPAGGTRWAGGRYGVGEHMSYLTNSLCSQAGNPSCARVWSFGTSKPEPTVCAFNKRYNGCLVRPVYSPND